MAAETYKGRQAFVYFPDQATLEQFKQRAKDEHKSLSSFIIETVEDYQRLQMEADPKPHLKKQIAQLRLDNDRLREELHIKSLAIEQLESKNQTLSKREYSYYYFGDLDEDSQPLDNEPIYKLTKSEADAFTLFKKYGNEQLQEELEKATYGDLQVLEQFGMIEETPKGWRLKQNVKKSKK